MLEMKKYEHTMHKQHVATIGRLAVTLAVADL